MTLGRSRLKAGKFGLVSLSFLGGSQLKLGQSGNRTGCQKIETTKKMPRCLANYSRYQSINFELSSPLLAHYCTFEGKNGYRAALQAPFTLPGGPVWVVGHPQWGGLSDALFVGPGKLLQPPHWHLRIVAHSPVQAADVRPAADEELDEQRPAGGARDVEGRLLRRVAGVHLRPAVDEVRRDRRVARPTRRVLRTEYACA